MSWAICLRCLLSLLILCLLSPSSLNAVTLAWDANSEEDLAGYKLYRGYASGVYDTIIDVGNVTQFGVTGLALNQDYYFAVTAYDNEDPVNESDYSNEVLYAQIITIVEPPTNGAITWVEIIDPASGMKLGVDYEMVELPNGDILYIYYNLSPGQRVRLER